MYDLIPTIFYPDDSVELLQAERNYDADGLTSTERVLRPPLDLVFVLETILESDAGSHETDRYDPAKPTRRLLVQFRTA